MECKQMSELFFVLGDQTRLRIVKLLQQGAMCANKLLISLNISQPTLSYHMNMLHKKGLVDVARCGKLKNYSLNKQTFKMIASYFEHSAECINLLNKES